MTFPVPPFHDFSVLVAQRQRDQDMVAWLNKLYEWGKQVDATLASLEARIAALEP